MLTKTKTVMGVVLTLRLTFLGKKYLELVRDRSFNGKRVNLFWRSFERRKKKFQVYM